MTRVLHIATNSNVEVLVVVNNNEINDGEFFSLSNARVMLIISYSVTYSDTIIYFIIMQFINDPNRRRIDVTLATS